MTIRETSESKLISCASTACDDCLSQVDITKTEHFPLLKNQFVTLYKIRSTKKAY